MRQTTFTHTLMCSYARKQTGGSRHSLLPSVCFLAVYWHPVCKMPKYAVSDDKMHLWFLHESGKKSEPTIENLKRLLRRDTGYISANLKSFPNLARSRCEAGCQRFLRHKASFAAGLCPACRSRCEIPVFHTGILVGLV